MLINADWNDVDLMSTKDLIGRTKAACSSKLTSLKRDQDMKWLKPKTTNHYTKVDDKLREELKSLSPELYE